MEKGLGGALRKKVSEREIVDVPKGDVEEYLLYNRVRIDILQVLILVPGITASALAKRTDTHVSTVNWHITRMKKYDIVDVRSFNDKEYIFPARLIVDQQDAQAASKGSFQGGL